MKTITFTCETITPMFLSGADGTTPELRPPSIKGALRFWWRAMNGELAQNEIYLDLKDEEQNIFGGVGGFVANDKKTDALKSKFNVRVSNVHYDFPTTIQERDFDGKGGLEYFFYLIAAEMTQNNQAFTKAKFDVIITAYEEEDLLQACASFWLLTYFGGLGSRARRGAGSFEIYLVEDKENILEGKLKMMPDNPSRSFLNEGLKQVSAILKKGSGNVSKKYSTIQLDKIYIAKNSKNNWKEALNEIGASMKDFRTDTERNPKQRRFTQKTLNQKAAFGLPISVRNEGSNVEFDNPVDFNHRSSPLYISVVRLKDKFYWTLVHLQGEFMPPNTNINFQSNAYNQTFNWQDVDNQLINKFIKNNIEPNSHK
ncbi:type III-B CRISPR module RAMP protein Cmr1 [Hugenholtzia roseola]|uniref:type III-B CRISPR module RAMP protein Cmr1 n=1 Tax=Hugenholtzia roseola TaxID=1002 RepID=UPI000478A5BE|nr:type III-B CRISPR module RAMP protein Cmr1 [Hugenholtzia roseola]